MPRSAGLGGRGFKLAISRRGARARTLKTPATPQVERHEGGAFGERVKRTWGEQWAEGAEVSVNLHWWSRRSALQVRDCARTSDFHRVSPVAAAAVEHLKILAIREHIQRACGSEETK